MTTQPLTRDGALSDSEARHPIIRMDEKHRGNSLVLWGFIIMFIGIAFGVTGKMLLHQEFITGIGVLISVLGMFLTAYPYLFTPSRARSDHNTSPGKVLTSPQQAKLLPGDSGTEYIPSITEKTTDLLQHSSVTRPGQKDDGA
jgi:hypothetical protein